jgi:ketopantoate hydroxymethyltransferase
VPPGQRAEQASQLAHRGGGVAAVAHDVADDHHRRAVGLEERVVPVAAHLGVVPGGLVPHGDVQVVGLGRRGEQRLLQPVGELPVRGGRP